MKPTTNLIIELLESDMDMETVVSVLKLAGIDESNSFIMSDYDEYQEEGEYLYFTEVGKNTYAYHYGTAVRDISGNFNVYDIHGQLLCDECTVLLTLNTDYVDVDGKGATLCGALY